MNFEPDEPEFCLEHGYEHMRKHSDKISYCAECERIKEAAPYGPMCRDPKLCAGKGYCPRDPTCGD